MKFYRFAKFGYFLFFLCALTTAPAGSEEIDAKAKEMMAKWMEYATPNENHKVFDSLVGQWSYAGKWWMAPNGNPEIFGGDSEIKWIMGGRFLQHSTKSTFKGQPFEGLGITGYDNGQDKYQTLWIDNMGTGMMRGTGTYDAAKKELHDEGHFSDHIRGLSTYRGVIRIIDADHYQYEMHTIGPDGKEFLAMMIDYTRK